MADLEAAAAALWRVHEFDPAARPTLVTATGKRRVDHVAVAREYAGRLLSGSLPAGEAARRAAARFLADLEEAARPGAAFAFDPERARRPCAFVEALRHVKGRWAGKPLILSPWQSFVIVNLFGFVKPDGSRLYRRAFLLVPRKNGKTLLVAAIGLYMLLADGEAGAEVYAGATTQKQALEVFGPASRMAEAAKRASPRIRCDVRASQILTPDGGKFEPLIGNPGDGSSPHCAITDEYHEHGDARQVETMQTGMGARDQPLHLVISTAGENLEGPCYLMQQGEARAALEGAPSGRDLFALVYEPDLPPDGTPADESWWLRDRAAIEANPNLGVSVNVDWLRAQRDRARDDPAAAAAYRKKHLNRWDGARDAYFSAAAWASAPRWEPGVLEPGPGVRWFLGVDLASKIDLAAAVLVGIEGPLSGDMPARIWWRSRLWTPEAALRSDGASRIREFVRAGAVQVTAGDLADYDAIREWIRETVRAHRVEQVGLDLFNAVQLTSELAEGRAGPNGAAVPRVPAVGYPQTVRSMSNPTKVLAALVKAGRVVHDHNPAAAWCVGNVVCRTDAKDNVYPAKAVPGNKIDAAIAGIMALGLGIAVCAKPGSVYEARGLATVGSG